MEDILRDVKSYTSRTLKQAIENNPTESRREWLLWMMRRAGKKNSNNSYHQFWQQDNHPMELWDNYMMETKLEYLHKNLVVSGFVDKAEDYFFSSARDYSGQKGLIEIKFIQ